MHLSNDWDKFQRECEHNIAANGHNQSLRKLSRQWMAETSVHKYVYNWRWCGLPIIQFPQDMVAFQEIVWEVRPNVIIETGVARGGSLLLSAALLSLLDVVEGRGVTLHTTSRKVIGIDIEIRPHNRKAIESHPLAPIIQLIEGSSVAEDVVADVRSRVTFGDRVLVILDSNHTHEHVLGELHAYGPLVTPESYCIVQDTGIEDAPQHLFAGRPWRRGNSPKSAVAEFLASHPEFAVDQRIDHKLLISSSPGGYLRRVS